MPRNSGFSLVEVMCAVLILGVALAGLVQGVTTALSSGKESELQTTAALLASGRIEQLRADGEIVDGESDGDWGTDFGGYQWKQTISSSNIKGLHEVDLVVEQVQSGKQILELRTMLFEPYLTAESEETTKGKESEKKKKKRTEQ